MKKSTQFLAMLALFGFAMPLTAAPQEVAVDNQPVLEGEMDADEVAELEAAEGWTIGGYAGVDFRSKYVTYGLVDNPHAIIVPGVELSLVNDAYFTLSVGVESIFDTTNYGAKDGGYNDRRWKYMELDPYVTLSRAWDTEDYLGGTLNTSVNYCYEYHSRASHKPAQEFSYADAQWLTFEIGLEDELLNPTFTLEYQLTDQGEWEGKGGIYATFSLSHEFDIGAPMGLEEGTLCLTPTAGLGMANKDRNYSDFELNDKFMFRDAFARLELSYTPVEGLCIAPYIACHQQIDSKAREATDDDQFVAYAGLGLSYEF